MASLTLKNLPDELLDALRAAAKEDRRSLNQEVVRLLEGALRGERRPARGASDAQVAAWRRLAGKWESDVDSATESKRIMSRRTKGRKVDL